MHSLNFLKGRRSEQITDAERLALESVLSEPEQAAPRTLIVRAGERVDRSILLTAGTMCRYMDDRMGHRQLVALQLPGDFVDLHGFTLRRLDHDVATMTGATFVTVQHAKLKELCESQPHLTRMFWFSTLLDAAMHREWIFRLGRLDAAGRLAHFIAEVECRLRLIGMSDGESFPLPLTQSDLGDACGLSHIHVSRMLSRLRAEGIADMRRGTVRIIDTGKLYRLAEFDPGYLYLDDGLMVP